MDDMKSRPMILWFFLGLFFISIFMIGMLIWPFVSILIVAAVVTGLFSPVDRFLKKRIAPSIASLLTCLLVFLVLLIPVLFFIGILTKEAYDLYLMGKSAEISDLLRSLLEGSRVADRLNHFLAGFQITVPSEAFNQAISEVGREVGLFLFQQANAIGANFLRFWLNFFLMLLVVYFLLRDGGRLAAFLSDLSPLPREQDEKLIQKFKEMAGAILIGNGLAGLLQGTLGGAVFALFGLNSPFLWGVVMGILAFLPILGIGLVFVPAAAYLFLQGRVLSGLFFLVFYIVLSGGVEYLLKPRLVGQRVKMHTLLVFLAMMGGLKLFGILGIIYGPLVVTAFLTLSDIYRSSYQRLIEPTGESVRPAAEN